MKKVKTSSLVGVELDWAVAQCELRREYSKERGTLVHRIGYGQTPPAYSTDWSLGGPIIEREFIQLLPSLTPSEQPWHATNPSADYCIHQWGETPLIAAMRCYVASKLGNTVDIPEEL